ncbi:hypothetical protein L208DRAFT_1384990, partial [Tricholoma matsutake]
MHKTPNYVHLQNASLLTEWGEGSRGKKTVIQIKPRCAQPLTNWMGFNGSMSAIQTKPWQCTATHSLEVIMVACQHFKSKMHSHSHPRWDLMAASCQQFKSSPGNALLLTSWRISWQH